ncbi:MAG: MotA/TolQ/ExbB proton channel family protein [Hyphomicrobium sp.]|jgi:biopolymer transport protein ExbB
MVFDTHYFHDVCIYTLYGCVGVLTFVVVERLVYYTLLNMRTANLGAVIYGSKILPPEKVSRLLKRRDVITRSVASYAAEIRRPGVTRARLEDVSSAAFVKVSGHIGARLWLLDTIVTAAPLLGLLGTILGIMDTFNALSAGGISDPAAVSRGIAAALLATAIGIGTALYGLLGYNLLHRFSDHLTERFKQLLLLAENLHRPDASADKTHAAGPGENVGAVSQAA